MKCSVTALVQTKLSTLPTIWDGRDLLRYRAEDASGMQLVVWEIEVIEKNELLKVPSAPGEK